MQFKFDDIYGAKKRLLLYGTALKIENNTLTVITGQNGTGKTLLLNKMFELCIDAGLNAVYVEQSNKFLLPKATILQNITMSENENEVKKSEEFLRKYGLEHLINHKPKELSGGEKRIICLMRCFFSNADIIFIDEPTNDLDFCAVKILNKLFDDIRLKKTIIVVSHDDRIKAIADNHIKIEDKKIISINSVFAESLKKVDGSVISNEITEDRISFLKKIVKINVVSSVVALLVAVVSIYALYLYIDGQYVNTKEIAKGEVNIFTLNSQMANDVIDSGAIPVYALSCFNNNLNFNEKLDIYYKSLSNSQVMPVNYGLNIDGNSDYKVFNLEYYDTINKSYFYTLDYYKVKANVKDEENIDTGRYFVLGGIDSPKVNVNFSLEQFNQYKESMLDNMGNNSSAECTFIAINLGEDTDFLEFINSNSMQNLMNGNFYIRSSETIELVNNIESLRNVKNLFFLLFFMGIILLITDIIITFICLFANKLIIRVFRNMGMERSIIISIMKKRYINNKFKIIVTIFVIICSITIQLIESAPLTVGSCINIIFLILVMFLSSKINDFIVEKYTKGICDWRYR